MIVGTSYLKLFLSRITVLILYVRIKRSSESMSDTNR